MKNDEAFDAYVESYKQLPLQEKKQIVDKEMKKTIAFIAKAKLDLGLKPDILLNREVTDLKSDNVTDADFVEAMFVYVHSIQEALGDYFNEVSKVLYK